MKKQTELGLLFALLATSMWGILPIVLQQVLAAMDTQTIVWYRFVTAAIGLWIILSVLKKRPKLTALSARTWGIIALGIIGLAANFFLYNLALAYVPPTTSQILSPLSAFGMLIVGVFLFKEKLALAQKIGLLLLIIGLICFFNHRVSDFLNLNQYVHGVIIAVAASLIWVLYGVSQKLLVNKLEGQQVLFLFYFGCSLLFLPTAEVSQIFRLNGFQLACLLFCCLNTLIAYGAYAEALKRTDVAKVSAVVSQIPIFTLIFSEIIVLFVPSYPVDHFNGLSYLGAVLVVSGALCSAIGQPFINKIIKR